MSSCGDKSIHGKRSRKFLGTFFFPKGGGKTGWIHPTQYKGPRDNFTSRVSSADKFRHHALLSFLEGQPRITTTQTGSTFSSLSRVKMTLSTAPISHRGGTWDWNQMQTGWFLIINHRWNGKEQHKILNGDSVPLSEILSLHCKYMMLNWLQALATHIKLLGSHSISLANDGLGSPHLSNPLMARHCHLWWYERLLQHESEHDLRT